jgi:ribosomal protein L6P/L9E
MQITTNITSSKTIKRVAITLLLVLLTCSGVFGQSKEVKVSLQNEVTVSVTTSNEILIAASDSDIDFMNWFMGSKQAQTSSSRDAINATTNTKKQLIISGGTPNRVLYRTFVKKVISIDNAIV